jgi:hypothetical protein
MSEYDPHMRDTTREAARVYYAALRAMRPEERLRLGLELSDRARALLEAGVRQRHPQYDDRAVRLAATRLSLGRRLFREAFSDQEIET